MFNIVIIRYGEIFLKSNYVRRRFEDILTGNLDLRLKQRGLEGKIFKKRGRIYIKTDVAEKVANELRDFFGIVSVSAAIETKAEISEISKEAVALAKETIKKGETFAADVQREGKHKFSSRDIEREVGEKILKEIETKVNLTTPDKTIFIEIRDDNAFVFNEKLRCFAGMPYKSQGKVVSLLSSGIDSPLATWFMMHRGCEIVLVHFGNFAEIEKIVEKLQKFVDRKIRLYLIDHDVILEKVAPIAKKNTCVTCKRVMLKVAEKICEIEKAQGIVTGDNLGQVASQTLENLRTISYGIKIPIYRPLIGMDKQESIDKAKEIGTFSLSVNKSCIYVPKKPATRAKIQVIERVEEELNVEEITENAIKCRN